MHNALAGCKKKFGVHAGAYCCAVMHLALLRCEYQQATQLVLLTQPALAGHATKALQAQPQAVSCHDDATAVYVMMIALQRGMLCSATLTVFIASMY